MIGLACSSKNLSAKLIPVNGKIVPALHKQPFKFLGRWVYPAFGEQDEPRIINKFNALMAKTDAVKIDDRKKAWIYENGVLLAMSWDFMVYQFTESGIASMEATANRFLKGVW